MTPKDIIKSIPIEDRKSILIVIIPLIITSIIVIMTLISYIYISNLVEKQTPILQTSSIYIMDTRYTVTETNGVKTVRLPTGRCEPLGYIDDCRNNYEIKEFMFK